jgi:two-component system sensor histidine kinase MtrB
VRDSGPGVPEELIGKLFDRFVQASDEAARGRGHGLGLSIAQGIAELHAGRIVVRNLTEGGCEFTVQLPRAQEATGARDSAL